MQALAAKQTSVFQLDESRPLGLVLSGGGARGAFQVGVWEVLRNHPLGLQQHPLVISGTSAGAINGALIAAGLSPAAMLDFWIGLADRPPVAANQRFFASLERSLAQGVRREPIRGLRYRKRSLRLLANMLRKHPVWRRGGLLALLVEFVMTARFDNLSKLLDSVNAAYLFSTTPFRDRLIQAIGGETIRRPRVRLAINAVDVRTGEVVRFVNHPPAKRPEADARHYHYHPEISVDMVLASSSIPLLFNPVEIDDIVLWDGGLLVNTPLAPAVALGAKRIIPVLVTSKHNPPVDVESMTLGAGVERLADSFLENAYNADRKLLLERNKLAENLPELGLVIAELYEAIRPESSRAFNAGSYLYFERRALMRMYEAGRRAATDWLLATPHVETRADAG